MTDPLSQQQAVDAITGARDAGTGGGGVSVDEPSGDVILRSVDEVIAWLRESITNGEDWLDSAPMTNDERLLRLGGRAALVELYEWMTNRDWTSS